MPHQLEVTAAAPSDSDKLLVTLANHSFRPARIIGNQGACGKGGCITPMSLTELSQLSPVVPGGEETFSFSTRRAPAEDLSCSVLIRVDHGGRLREFTIRLQGRPGDLLASVEEQTVGAKPQTESM